MTQIEEATRLVTGSADGIGASVGRTEDERLLTGASAYLGDLPFADVAEAAFVRSPHPHARIGRIRTERALAAPGVLQVITGTELAQLVGPLRMAPPIEGLQPMEMAPLATDKARFEGDPVALVVARDRYLAEDAVELVEVDYEPLAPVLSEQDSLGDAAPLVDESLQSNLLCHQTYSSGSPAEVLEQADEILRLSFSQHRQTHAPMEPRGCVAVWDRQGTQLTLHTGTQVPHPYRSALAARLGVPEHDVRVVCPDIGGAFGQKLVAYREEAAVAAVARSLRRPVRWREDRRENLLSALHAREDAVDVEVGVTRAGRILALRARLASDFGAYSYFPGNYMLQVIGMMLPGAYRFAHYAYEVNVYLSTKCPAGPYRAPMAMCTWVTEGMIDAIAERVGRDPVEVRRANTLVDDDIPYQSPSGQLYEDVTPSTTLEEAVAAFDYDGARRRQQAARAEGRCVGIGVATVIEPTTYGSSFYKMAGIPGSGHEAAVVRIEPSGWVNVSVGLMASGQGYETMLAQVVAEGLGVPAGHVRVLLGDTPVGPYGMGSRGSRGATAGGGVALLASQELQRKVLDIAAHLLGEPVQNLTIANAEICRRDDADLHASGLRLADVARRAYLDPLSLPEGLDPGLEVHRTYDPPSMTYSNATHVCQVEIDPGTGAVSVPRYLVAEDAGRLINPTLVEGQIHGAVALGLGGTLQEEVAYGDGGHNLSDSFRTYRTLAMDEMPDEIELVHCDTPNQRTPGGMKGMSEGGVMGAIAAVALAVQDALRPYGATVDRLPLTDERILGHLRDTA